MAGKLALTCTPRLAGDDLLHGAPGCDPSAVAGPDGKNASDLIGYGGTEPSVAAGLGDQRVRG